MIHDGRAVRVRLPDGVDHDDQVHRVVRKALHNWYGDNPQGMTIEGLPVKVIPVGDELIVVDLTHPEAARRLLAAELLENKMVPACWMGEGWFFTLWLEDEEPKWDSYYTADGVPARYTYPVIEPVDYSLLFVTGPLLDSGGDELERFVQLTYELLGQPWQGPAQLDVPTLADLAELSFTDAVATEEALKRLHNAFVNDLFIRLDLNEEPVEWRFGWRRIPIHRGGGMGMAVINEYSRNNYLFEFGRVVGYDANRDLDPSGRPWGTVEVEAGLEVRRDQAKWSVMHKRKELQELLEALHPGEFEFDWVHDRLVVTVDEMPDDVKLTLYPLGWMAWSQRHAVWFRQRPSNQWHLHFMTDMPMPDLQVQWFDTIVNYTKMQVMRPYGAHCGPHVGLLNGTANLTALTYGEVGAAAIRQEMDGGLDFDVARSGVYPVDPDTGHLPKTPHKYTAITEGHDVDSAAGFDKFAFSRGSPPVSPIPLSGENALFPVEQLHPADAAWLWFQSQAHYLNILDMSLIDEAGQDEVGLLGNIYIHPWTFYLYRAGYLEVLEQVRELIGRSRSAALNIPVVPGIPAIYANHFIIMSAVFNTFNAALIGDRYELEFGLVEWYGQEHPDEMPVAVDIPIRWVEDGEWYETYAIYQFLPESVGFSLLANGVTALMVKRTGIMQDRNNAIEGRGLEPLNKKVLIDPDLDEVVVGFDAQIAAAQRVIALVGGDTSAAKIDTSSTVVSHKTHQRGVALLFASSLDVPYRGRYGLVGSTFLSWLGPNTRMTSNIDAIVGETDRVEDGNGPVRVTYDIDLGQYPFVIQGTLEWIRGDDAWPSTIDVHLRCGTGLYIKCRGMMHEGTRILMTTILGFGPTEDDVLYAYVLEGGLYQVWYGFTKVYEANIGPIASTLTTSGLPITTKYITALDPFPSVAAMDSSLYPNDMVYSLFVLDLMASIEDAEYKGNKVLQISVPRIPWSIWSILAGEGPEGMYEAGKDAIFHYSDSFIDPLSLLPPPPPGKRWSRNLFPMQVFSMENMLGGVEWSNTPDEWEPPEAEND